MVTYLSNHAVSQEIASIRPGDPEFTTFQFPISDGYITRPQDCHTSQGGQRGFSDLHVFQYVGNAPKATKFLIAQCKRAGYETRDAVWDDAVQQLSEYLSNTHGRRRPAERIPVYGIVAVGRYMRAYRYDNINQCVLNWAPSGMRGPRDQLQNHGPWHLKNDAGNVQLILNHILNNH
ncbi:hypothetical protein N7527_006253 [Penicillium freii]|nr:hypothetical protein N7527_006253 [Penicillium freii]